MTELLVRVERWPLAGVFAISRGSKTAAEVVVVELRRAGCIGRGECVPYGRYAETVEGVVGLLEGLAGPLAAGLDRQGVQQALPPGAARNALDCAFWDLEAKLSQTSVYALAGLAAPKPVVTAYTISLDTPEKMGAAAGRHANRPLLKVKLAGEGDQERLAAVREHAPAARLIVDANEGWSAAQVEPFAAALAELGVSLIEQPLPAGSDQLLAEIAHPVPFCADESCHTSDALERLAPLYDVVNVKLDKTGGLTEALRLKERAHALGLEIMMGCMVATSLAMAPALLLAQDVCFVDLDGPLLLAEDRQPGLIYKGSLVHPAVPALWG